MSMIGNFVAVTDLQLATLRKAPNQIVDFLEGAEDERQLDIDKAWHGIHFLLTGSAWNADLPLGFILGGVEIGDIDVGYGPARGLTQGHDIAQALSSVDTAKLISAWDADAIRRAEIYAVNPDAPEDEAAYLGGYFEELKEFVDRTAADGMALLAFLS
jgi:hypothetical protein